MNSEVIWAALGTHIKLQKSSGRPKYEERPGEWIQKKDNRTISETNIRRNAYVKDKLGNVSKAVTMHLPEFDICK
jgi:hypothetical protein